MTIDQKVLADCKRIVALWDAPNTMTLGEIQEIFTYQKRIDEFARALIDASDQVVPEDDEMLTVVAEAICRARGSRCSDGDGDLADTAIKAINAELKRRRG